MKEKIIAKAKYLRTSPQKAGLVLALIRGQSLAEAQRILKFSPKRAAKSVLKTLNSAAANAKQKGLKEEDLKIAKATADSGPTFKRTRFVSRGRVHRILKRTAHVTIELEGEKENGTKDTSDRIQNWDQQRLEVEVVCRK